MNEQNSRALNPFVVELCLQPSAQLRVVGIKRSIDFQFHETPRFPWMVQHAPFAAVFRLLGRGWTAELPVLRREENADG